MNKKREASFVILALICLLILGGVYLKINSSSVFFQANSISAQKKQDIQVESNQASPKNKKSNQKQTFGKKMVSFIRGILQEEPNKIDPNLLRDFDEDL